MFPIADGTVTLLGRDPVFRKSTLESEDLRGEFQGNSERPQPTETQDDAEARNDFWSIERYFTYRHHINHSQLH